MSFHDRFFVSIALEETPTKNLYGSIVHFFPSIEAATLAQCSDGVRECVVQVVEEDLIPTVLSSQERCHNVVEDLPGTIWITGKKMIPHVGVVEVYNEYPSGREARSHHCRNYEHEL